MSEHRTIRCLYNSNDCIEASDFGGREIHIYSNIAHVELYRCIVKLTYGMRWIYVIFGAYQAPCAAGKGANNISIVLYDISNIVHVLASSG